MAPGTAESTSSQARRSSAVRHRSRWRDEVEAGDGEAGQVLPEVDRGWR